MDALTGIVYKDDSQIEQGFVTKYYDKENPRIEIEINCI
jgi:Holliday junction resolvase RusA-like endonuclease